MARFLDNNLMIRSSVPLAGASGRERYGYLEQNFDRSLLQLFAEVQFWERLRFEIPYIALDITHHRERYRCLRENVMLVVREYNSILKALLPQERRLFAERLYYLDRKIAPGLNKLTWASKQITEVFLKEVRRVCFDVLKLVQDFHHSNRLLLRACRQVAAMPLVALKKKTVYLQQQFEAEQHAHHENVRSRFQVTPAWSRSDGDRSMIPPRSDDNAGIPPMRRWRA